MTAPALIYRLCSSEEWETARAEGLYRGGAHDARDGFIHFSALGEIVESAARHHPGVEGLMLLAVDASGFGATLRWEASRDGKLFPHLYDALPISAVRWVAALPLGVDGRHLFPPLESALSEAEAP